MHHASSCFSELQSELVRFTAALGESTEAGHLPSGTVVFAHHLQGGTHRQSWRWEPRHHSRDCCPGVKREGHCHSGCFGGSITMGCKSADLTCWRRISARHGRRRFSQVGMDCTIDLPSKQIDINEVMVTVYDSRGIRDKHSQRTEKRTYGIRLRFPARALFPGRWPVIIVGFRSQKLEASVWTLAYDPFRVDFKSCNCCRISVTFPATVITQNRVTTNKTGQFGRLNP